MRQFFMRQFFSNANWNNKDYVLRVVRQNGWDLQHVNPALKANKEVVLVAVEADGRALQYASPALKADQEVVLAAVQKDGRALEYASPDLKEDKDVVLAAVKQEGAALYYASKELKKDQEVVLAAVEQNGWALQYADPNLRQDRAFILKAVRQSGCALQFASDELRNDQEVVLAAVQQDGHALRYANPKLLQEDPNIVSEAKNQIQHAQLELVLKLQKDRDSILKEVGQNGMALEHAPAFQTDKEVVLAAVRQNGMALEYASPKFKIDEKVVLAAVQQNGMALKYATQQDSLALYYATYSTTFCWRSLNADENIVLAATRQNGEALQYAHSELKKDRYFISRVVGQNGEALQFASDELKKDRDFVLNLVHQNPFAIIYQKDQAIGFTKEEDKAIHLKAFKRQAEILFQTPQESPKYEKLHEQHVKHFEQLSRNNIDCLSRMLTGLKKDPRVIKALLLRNDILKKELNDCLLDCFKKATQYIQGTTQPVIQSSFEETLLKDLPSVKTILDDSTDTQKEKWNGFISFLQTQGLVQDDELKNLVLPILPTKNKPSQSASSGSARGVFNFLLGGITRAAEQTLIAAGSSSDTRRGEYPFLDHTTDWRNDINWSDKDSVLEAVKLNGRALQHANRRLKNDPEIVKEAVKQCGEALQYANRRLKNDPEIVEEAVKKDGMALQYASDELQKNRDIVKAAVKKDGMALKFASEELQNNPEIVKAAVKKDGMALEHASYWLRADRKIVLAAVGKNGDALQYAHPVLKEDRDFILEAAKRNVRALQYAHYDLQNDRDFILAAVQENPFAIIYQQNAIGFETDEDKAIHLKAFKDQAEILATIPKQSEQYQALCWQHITHLQQLLSNNIDCISYMFTGLKQDPRVIPTLLSRDDISGLNNCLLAYFKKDQLAITDFREKLSLKELKDVKNGLFLTFEEITKWDDFIYFLKDNHLVQNDEVRNLVFITRGKPSQSASSGSAGVAAEQTPIATGSSSGTRGEEYPSSAPQPRGAGDVARGAGDVARGAEAASSSGSRFAPQPRGTGAASSNEDPRSR